MNYTDLFEQYGLKLTLILSVIYALYGLFLLRNKKTIDDGIIWLVFSAFFYFIVYFSYTDTKWVTFLAFFIPIPIYLIIKKFPKPNTEK